MYLPAMRSTVFILLTVLLAACGSGRPAPSLLPENIAAEPRGMLGIVATSPTTSLPTALRALGVPYRTLPIVDLDDRQFEGLSMIVFDEGSLDDPKLADALPRLFDHARTTSTPLLMLAQTHDKGRETLRMNAAPIEPRAVGYSVDLVAPQSNHRVLITPNRIDADDLEVLSESVSQLARGRSGGRAILAGNLERPDSSAALLRVPYGKGSIWYVAFPLAAPAASGLGAGQRMLANLVSLGIGD